MARADSGTSEWLRACGRCGSSWLTLDSTVYRETNGRLFRVSCWVCGWDVFTREGRDADRFLVEVA